MGELHFALAIVIARQLLERALEGSGPTSTPKSK